MMKQNNGEESNLPMEIGQTARRALVEAGYPRLEQLFQVSEKEIKQLHGVGPKAIRLLRQALAAHGQAFANEKL